MKTRFDGLDVLAMCCHLQRTLLGAKVVNIYDALDSNNNKDSYTLKLDSGSGKVFLKLQSGVQFHAVIVGNPQPDDNDKNNSSTTTVVENFANTAPSPFCSKLRKHLKGMRLEHICQLGQLDRVVWFKFLGSAGTCSLILELYSKGNLVLTQGPQFEIVALLRSHVYSGATTQPQQQKEGNEANEDSTPNENADVQVRVGKVYPVTYATTTTSATNDAKEDDPGGLLAPNLSDALQWVQEQLDAEHNTKKSNKKKGNTTGLTLKTLLLKPSSGVSHFGPALLEHVIWSCNSVAENDNDFVWKPHEPLAIDGGPASGDDKEPSSTATASNKLGGLTREQWQTLIHQLKTEAPAVLERLRQAAQHEMPGYLLYKSVDDDDNAEKDTTTNTTTTKTSTALIESTLPHPNKMLLEFQPHLLRQHAPNLLQQKNVRVFETRDFGRAVADFYGQLQSQKTRQKALSQQQAAQARLRNIQLDQQQRAAALERDIYQQQQRAALVEAHAAQVDQALQILNSALQSGMDWEQLQDVIHVEQEERHNPIALLIHELKLQDDEVVLRLPTTATHHSEDGDDDQDNDDNDTKDRDTTPPYLDVTVRLQETAHANASRLFANYRASKEKSRKTQEASEKAIAAAQATAERQLAQAQNQLKGGGGGGGLYAPRKPAWFEKFYWMVTRDNYLVLCGKDAHQNELLVKRYLRRGDAYLHADVHGAASCVLRAKRARRNNNSKSEPLPLSEMALQEAGQFTLCHSSAWSSRMMTSAWWVESHQVSKTAPTGEYLTVGSFMVRGKKNYLPPSPLELGLGVLFRLGDAESIARHKDKDRRDFMLLHQETEEEEEGRGLGKQDVKLVAEAQRETDEGDGLKNNHALSENTDDPAQDNGENDAQQEREDGLVESMDPAPSEPQSDDVKEDGASTAPTAKRGGDEGEAEGLAPDKVANGQLGNEGAMSEEVPAVAPSKKKKGLSVKDRKLIKKYGSLEEAERVLSQEQQSKQNANALASTSIPDRLSDTASLASSSAATNHTANTVKRGKKSKLKRQKKRYADQDDEDRELALLLLHGGGGPKTNGGNQKNKGSGSAQNKAQPKTTAEQLVGEETAAALTKNSRLVAERLPESVRVVLEKCLCNNCDRDSVPWERIDGDVVEQLVVLLPQEAQLAAVERLASLQESTQVRDHLTSSLAGILRTIRKYGYKNLGEADTKKNDKAGEHSEDNGDQNEEDEDEIDDTVELNKLTGKPVIEDVLLHAVPICAPYASLSGCSYRVKLTPGNMKRGKAGKQCLEIILQQVQQQSKLSSSSNCGTNNIHRELIKRVTDNELVQCLISDVKIAAAGSSKLIKQQKGKGKKKK